MTRFCYGCEKELPFSRFYKQANGYLGHRSVCKGCESAAKKADYQKRKAVYAERSHVTYMKNRKKRYEQTREWQRNNKSKASDIWHNAHLRREYGIGMEDYNRMLANQDGRCAICKAAPLGRRFAVDHNHTTGVVRGLLCLKCNSSLGFLMEDISKVDALRQYIVEHEQPNSQELTR